MKTTINSKELKTLKACVDGYSVFIKAHGDNAVNFSEALKSNGLDDLLWLLVKIEQDLSDHQIKDLRLLAADYALSCIDIYEKEYPEDLRPRKAIESSIAYVNGEISIDELNTARSAAESARLAAAAARSAAWSAESAAARSAAWSAESAAAAAARSAAWSAESARLAAWSAESAAWSAESAAAAHEEMLLKVLLKWEL